MKTIYLFVCSLFMMLLISGGCNQPKPAASDINKNEADKPLNSKDGPYVKNDEDGHLMEKGVLKNGEQEGKRNVFFPNGKTRIEEMYVKGEYDGPFKEYFETGKLMQEGQYVKNSMTGIWKTYYDSGELKEEVLFKDNNENGPFKKYYKNGKIKWEGSYKDGDHEDGELKLYNEDGELIKKQDCVKGDCNTIWVKKGYEDAKK